MAFRILDDRGDAIEPHRLRIEQCQGELGWIVAFEISRRIADEGKTRRVRFRKAVLAKPANLLKGLLGKRWRYALGDHPRHQSLPMLLDPPAAPPGRHV